MDPIISITPVVEETKETAKMIAEIEIVTVLVAEGIKKLVSEGKKFTGLNADGLFQSFDFGRFSK